MRTKFLLYLIFLCCFNSVFVRAQVLVWSDNFTQSGTPLVTQAQYWIDYRNSLIPRQYYKVRMSGSGSSTVMECNNAVIVNDMAAKLRTGTPQTWMDGSNTWNVGSCGSTTAGTGIEFSVNSGNCACQNSPSIGYVIRPGIGNLNWGGVGTATCTGPSQTMTVEFYYSAGFNNAAVTAVTNPLPPFCPGNQNVVARVKNNGQNRINNVKVFWELDGVLQPVVNHVGLIDTFGGSGANSVTIPLGNVNFSGSPRNLKIYTSQPNGGVDTVNNDDTFKVSLSPSPKAVITANGPTVFCTAGTINVTLNAAAGGSSIYQWFRDNTPIPGAINSSYTATLAGDYTVQVDSNGCSNQSAITRVDNLAMPLPVVHPSGYPVLCSGDSLVLTANAGITGASYQWQFQGADILGATNASYTVTSPGNYTVITSKFVCKSSSPGVNVVPSNHPTPFIEEEPNGTLKTDPTFVSYQWQVDGNDIPGATFFAHKPMKAGSYTVIVSNGGCSGTSDAKIVGNVSVSNIYTVDNIRFYPNPASSILYIDAPGGSDILISSIEGKVMLKQQNIDGKINLNTIPAGIYIIKISDTKGIHLKTDKFIIAR